MLHGFKMHAICIQYMSFTDCSN